MSVLYNGYISSITSSASWGGDGGSVQATLVSAPEWGRGVILPQTGAPTLVGVGSLEFGGVFQKWGYKESTSGRFYDVVIESAAKLLDGVQVVLSDWNGQTFSTYNALVPAYTQPFTNELRNIWNPFAERENTLYGNNAYFGGSDVNSSGFPIGSLLTELTKIGNGEGIFGGKATFSGWEFGIDLSGLQSYLGNSNARIQGPVQSLKAIIDTCCEIAGLDYFVTLYPGPNSSITNGIMNKPVIYIQPISRAEVPDSGAVFNYVESLANTGLVVSSNIGYENTSPTTQSMVLGGRASRYIVQNATMTTWPVWGKKANAHYIVGQYKTPVEYNNYRTRVPVMLDEWGDAPGYTATVMEIRMAQGGKEVWETYKAFETMYGAEPNGFNSLVTCPWAGKVEGTLAVFSRLGTGSVSSDFSPSSASYASRRGNLGSQELCNKIYNAVSRVANNFYGQVFSLGLDYYEPGETRGNVKWLRDDLQKIDAWDIVDSAYTNTVYFDDIHMMDGEGKLKNAATWPYSAAFDYSDLGSDWSVPRYGGIGTSKASIEKDIYWSDGFPYVIARTGGKVQFYDGITTPDFGFGVLLWYFTGVIMPPATYLTAGGQNVQFAIPPAAVYPIEFGISQESNRYVWGPFYAWSGGKISGSKVEFDGGLTPDNYGSEELMNAAGIEKAMGGLSTSGANESGQVELVGLPISNLAGRFAGSGPYISNIDVNVTPTQTTTTYKLNTWTPQFGKMQKINIERMQKINKGIVALMQSNRQKITKRPLPKFPFHPSKFDFSGARQNIAPQFFHSWFNNVAAGAIGGGGGGGGVGGTGQNVQYTTGGTGGGTTSQTNPYGNNYDGDY